MRDQLISFLFNTKLALIGMRTQMTKAEKAPKNDMTDSKPGQKIAVATTSAVVIILTSTLTVALIGFGASVSDIREKADEFAR